MALFTKDLKAIKKKRDQILAIKKENADNLEAAKATVENIKAEMATALEDGDITRYGERAAALAAANTAVKTAEDAKAVSDAFPEVNPDEVTAAWNIRAASLNKDIAAAEKNYQKAMDAFKDAYITLARELNRCRLERDEFADLISPGVYPKVNYSPIDYFNEYQKLPADFAKLSRPFDTGKMHPRVDEPLKWFYTDPSVKAANAVVLSGCSSAIDF